MSLCSPGPLVPLLRAEASPHGLVIAGAHPTGIEERSGNLSDFSSTGLDLGPGRFPLSFYVVRDCRFEKGPGVTY